jgi:hypothetical protein
MTIEFRPQVAAEIGYGEHGLRTFHRRSEP